VRRLLALLVLIVPALAGCGDPAASGEPPEIDYGRDICVECGMIISDDRFAAAYRLSDGTEKAFDDLGGLLTHGREAGELSEAAVWVSDFDEKELIDAAAAHFVPTLGAESPMGYGILAFSDHDRAMRAAADLGGEVIGWGALLELPLDRPAAGSGMDMGSGDGMEDADDDAEGHDHAGDYG